MQPGENHQLLSRIQTVRQPMTCCPSNEEIGEPEVFAGGHRAPMQGDGLRLSAESHSVPMRQCSHVAPKLPERRYWWTADGEEKSPATGAAGEVPAHPGIRLGEDEPSAGEEADAAKASAEKWRRWLWQEGVNVSTPRKNRRTRPETSPAQELSGDTGLSGGALLLHRPGVLLLGQVQEARRGDRECWS